MPVTLLAIGACLTFSPIILFFGEILIHSPPVQRVFDSLRHGGHIPVLIPKTFELIAFVCGDNTDPYNRIFNNSLFTVRHDGSHLRDISIDESMIHYDLDWSPDGEWLALTLQYDNVASLMDEWNPAAFYHEIHRLRHDGTEARRLTYNESDEKKPRWTRDSRDILYHDTWSGTWQLHRVSMAPTNPHALTTLEVSDFDLSPDRQKIVAIVRKRDGESHSIYLLNPDGTGLAHLMTPDVFVSEIQWSADNKLILYYAYNNLPTIYNIVAGREEPVPLIRIRSARWSPDNRWIAIIGGLDRYKDDDEWIDINGTSDEKLTNSLHLYDIVTGELKELVSASAGHVSSASWSPDSQWLAFSQGSPNAQVYKIRVDGSGLQQLTDLDCGAYGVVWSPM
ncbi:MAG: hypothetical protein OXG53_17610 [Chloroflexi bacterium]|nr:hypothetical protein [Chloroflexota bacterium]